MLSKLIVSLIASVIGAILYRAGGMAKKKEEPEAKPKWIPDFMRASWVRDGGVSLVSVIALLCILSETIRFQLVNIIVYLLVLVISWFCMNAYWGQDEKKYGFFWHGLGIALAIAPISLITGHWWGFLARLVVLPLLIAWWSDIQGDVVWEESGRGFLIISTLLLL